MNCVDQSGSVITMADMAKRKHNVSNQTKQTRTGTPHTVYLSDELSEALDRFLASERPKPTKTAVFETAIEMFLQARGYLPGPDIES